MAGSRLPFHVTPPRRGSLVAAPPRWVKGDKSPHPSPCPCPFPCPPPRVRSVLEDPSRRFSGGAPRGSHLWRFQVSSIPPGGTSVPKSPKMARPHEAIFPCSPRPPGAGADPASGFAFRFAVTGRPWLADSPRGLRRHESSWQERRRRRVESGTGTLRLAAPLRRSLRAGSSGADPASSCGLRRDESGCGPLSPITYHLSLPRKRKRWWGRGA